MTLLCKSTYISPSSHYRWGDICNFIIRVPYTNHLITVLFLVRKYVDVDVLFQLLNVNYSILENMFFF